MKDWKIIECEYPYTSAWLDHMHGDQYHYACMRETDDRWYCIRCGKQAPEEMGWVAELANCEPHYYEALDIER